MVSKLDKQTYTSEFESHWVPLSYGLVPHLSKKLRKFPLHPRDNADRLFVSRKEGGRRLAYIVDSVDASIQLEDSIQKRWGRLITATRNNADTTRSNKTAITCKQKLEEKQLHGHFKQLINNISLEKTRTWLRKVNVTRETESLLIAPKKNTIKN